MLINRVNMVFILPDAISLHHFRQNYGKNSGFAQKLNAFGGAITHYYFYEFISDSLSRDKGNFLIHFLNRLQRFLINKEIQLRGETHRAQKAQSILAESLFWIAHRADDFIF